MTNLGVPGYEPQWLNAADAVVAAHATRLSSLVGLPLRQTWVMWTAQYDSFWADGPVVLDFGSRLEVAHQKLDEVSITWDSIDLARPLDWYGADELALTWRRDAPPNLAELTGRTCTGVQILVWDADPEDFAYGTVAVGVAFGSTHLVIANGLDEVELKVGTVAPEYRAHWST